SRRAHLRHLEHVVPAILIRAVPPPLAFALLILPSVVQEIDAGIQRFVDDPSSLRDRLRFAEMVATEADDGHQVCVWTEGATRDRCVSGPHCSRLISRRALLFAM